VLTVGQIALTILLVTGTGLFARTLQNLRAADMGFNRDHILLASSRLLPFPDFARAMPLEMSLGTLSRVESPAASPWQQPRKLLLFQVASGYSES